MRVMFVTPYYPPAHLGGIERAIQRLAAALRARVPGIEPGVLTTSYAFPPRFVPGLPARERRYGLDVFRLRGRPTRPLPLFPYYSCPVTVFGVADLRTSLAAFRPDVVHMVGDGWAWAHLLLAALRGRATAVVFTPSFHSMTPSRQWLRLPNTLLCRVAERTTALTRLEAEGVGAAYHAPPERLRVVPWGVEAAPAPRPSRRGDDRPATILCVGRVGEHKGQRWLLATYRRARPAFRRPARLLFVGKDEGDAGRLAAEAAAWGLDGEVALAGEVDDAALDGYYAEADVFALFSQFEAFGLVYFEAMARGMPVLTHRVGANAELLTAGAVVVDRYDRDAAAEALARLVGDPDYRSRLGAEARDLVQSRFTWERSAERFYGVYEEAIDERRRAT